MSTYAELEAIASQVRRDVLRMIHAVQSGHPGASLGTADFLAVLYFQVMKHDPNHFTMAGLDEDLFFLSNGHLSAAWYSILAHAGYFEVAELATFRKIGTRLQGHPATAEGIPGVRIASGSLGQGLSVAIGAAEAKKLNGDPRIVYTLHGDGELQEGQIWEAAMYAAGKQVDNLIATIDYNGQQIDGPVDKVMPLGDLEAKWKAFGWEVLKMNGNNMPEIIITLDRARNHNKKGRPVVILMRTEMGHGVDFMLNNHRWHGSPPNDEQLRLALGQLEETLGDY
jgi:transketolase